ncbi:GNAT family N-acetyltransferase [Moorena sp. SIO4A5]|uniref:GNAT family N-acetyltransferase n=1 Tax=Moorena sp. SIO4A5 TaxID=2607838 RepID=UPI0013CA9285|nr:GNAT family N-acetyltransferase [Moorena sp. SIO4A5]NEO23877.1 GNAT family N-acetyltransferase [Moorena sp. SIO4A5]NEQ62062.1 GNAT family N-acetyltransferase [Moorena sp. SIO4A1]
MVIGNVTQEIQLQIEKIDEKSLHLRTVKALGRAHATTLGHFPEGAFDQHALSGQILVALTPEKKCTGYLLYRKVRRHNIIVIVHLCIEPSWRGNGIAKKLVNYLSQNTQDFYGIKLKCRRDYGLEKMWSHLDFVPLAEKPGRSKDGKLLTVWWRDHDHPTLFSTVATQKLESKLCAVIDTSVFFDLQGDEARSKAESDSLLADWLQPDLELCITNEIFKVINSIDDSKQRNGKRQLADTFTQLPYNQKDFQTACRALTKVLLSTQVTINKSDLSQLAIAIASDAPFFLTRNSQILAIADAINQEFNLSILSPTSLIVKLDYLHEYINYQPVRLAGTGITRQRVHKFDQVRFLSETFLVGAKVEKLSNFQGRLGYIIANPDKFKCYIILQSEKNPLALIAYHTHKNNELNVPIFRVRSGPLEETLARHLIFWFISLSVRENLPFTRITEPYLDHTILSGIQDDAFFKVKDGYLNANLAVAVTATELSDYLTTLANRSQDYNFCLKIADTLKTDKLTTAVKTTLDVERILWPAKIIDADLPTIIIPIQAEWAKELFDEDLANQLLWRSETDLALKRELVYYRSHRGNGGLKPGVVGRILWYVSYNKKYCGTGKVRACSRLDEVVVNKPKNLHQQFRRLGVYELEDLMKLTKNDPNKKLMALRFSDTELFKNPIDLAEIQEILGKRLTLQSPLRIYQEQFTIIYRECTQN